MNFCKQFARLEIIGISGNSQIAAAIIIAAFVGFLSIGFTMNDSQADQQKDQQANNQENKAQLTELQKYVIVHGGTERPFENEYWNHHEEGIYVDRVSGEALFSSLDKYDSGTGWPSFTKPIAKQSLLTKSDHTLGMNRTEVRSTQADSHLGHVFDDGSKDKGGKRFCINSASLRFVARAEMEKEGYGEYLFLFTTTMQEKK